MEAKLGNLINRPWQRAGPKKKREFWTFEKYNMEEEMHSVSLFNDKTYKELTDIIEGFEKINLDTPEGRATHFKELGNRCFQSDPKDFHQAIEFFSRAIAQKSKNDKLNSVCFSNRAAVFIELKKYELGLNDCRYSLELDVKNVKSWYRSAKALYNLKRFKTAAGCCGVGLHFDPGNEALIKLKVKCFEIQAKYKEEEVFIDDKTNQEAEKFVQALSEAKKLPLIKNSNQLDTKETFVGGLNVKQVKATLKKPNSDKITSKKDSHSLDKKNDLKEELKDKQVSKISNLYKVISNSEYDQIKKKYNAVEEIKTKQFKLALKKSNIRFMEANNKSLQPSVIKSNYSVRYDEETQQLMWPTFFLYPEFKRTDFISTFYENDTFETLIGVIFNKVKDWDDTEDPKYTKESIEIYFESFPINATNPKLFAINKKSTLKQVLKNEKFFVFNNTPSFILLSKLSLRFKGEFLDRYLKKV